MVATYIFGVHLVHARIPQMMAVNFVTTNFDKYKTAKAVCDGAGIILKRRSIEIAELQSEDSEIIVRDKATKAFQAVDGPVIVSDDSWSFIGLGGFPGPYMHSMNTWLTAEDFLHMTEQLADRKVILSQFLVFDDGTRQKLFRINIPGILLRRAQGSSVHASHQIIALNVDHGLSIAEALDMPDRSQHISAEVWHKFVNWYPKLGSKTLDMI